MMPIKLLLLLLLLLNKQLLLMIKLLLLLLLLVWIHQVRRRRLLVLVLSVILGILLLVVGVKRWLLLHIGRVRVLVVCRCWGVLYLEMRLGYRRERLCVLMMALMMLLMLMLVLMVLGMMRWWLRYRRLLLLWVLKPRDGVWQAATHWPCANHRWHRCWWQLLRLLWLWLLLHVRQ